MIELTIHGGRKVSVNPILVTHVEELSAGAEVGFAGGASLRVIETYGDVCGRVKAWVKG